MNTSISNYYLFNLDVHNDQRGKMCVCESGNNLPFLVKRFFVQYDFSRYETRGNHANMDSSFGFVCLKGQCKIIVDDSTQKEQFLLNNPNQGLYVNKMIWKEMLDFSDDCILLVLSDCKYNANEYIKDYNDYIKIKREENSL